MCLVVAARRKGGIEGVCEGRVLEEEEEEEEEEDEEGRRKGTWVEEEVVGEGKGAGHAGSLRAV